MLVEDSSKFKKPKIGVNRSAEKNTSKPTTIPVYVSAKGSTTLQALNMDQRPKMKCKRQANDQRSTTEFKAKKLEMISVPTEASTGTIQKGWRSKWHNKSCAFDTILFITVTSILATSVTISE